MGSLGQAPLGRSVFQNGPGALIKDTVSIAVACMKASALPDGEVGGFVKNIHTALLDVARDAVKISPELGRLGYGVQAGGETPLTTEMPDVRAENILQEIGMGLVKARYEEQDNLEASAETVSSVAPAAVSVAPVAAVQTAFEFAPPTPSVAKPRATARLAKPVTVVEPKPVPVVVAKPATKARRVTKAGPGNVVDFKGPKLPRRLKNIEDALTMKMIICLEDGKRVKDLGGHLLALGVTPDQYRAKWNLPHEYPMHAPESILARGSTFEVDFVTGNLRAVRKT